jgi:hypothetical protein
MKEVDSLGYYVTGSFIICTNHLVLIEWWNHWCQNGAMMGETRNAFKIFRGKSIVIHHLEI